MQKLQGIAGQGGFSPITSGVTSSSESEVTYPGCTIDVYLEGTTTHAATFSNSIGTVKANPFTADSTAAWDFYADPGTYDIRFSGTGIGSPFTISGVAIGGTPLNMVDANQYASLNAAVTAIGSSVKTLVISSANFPSGNSTSVPITLDVEFVGAGSILMGSSRTATFLGNIIAPARQIFFNALAGGGIISFAGNTKQRDLLAAWWGSVGDGSTDNTPILQTITDQLSTDNVDATLILPPGDVVIAGALQDTGASNAQWVLPRRTSSQMALRLKGSGAVASMTGLSGSGGTVLKSTLSSGTGNVIGSKTAGTFNATNVDLYLEDLTIQTVANPTNSALDLRYFKRVFAKNLKIWTGESSNWTQPTTATSYALRTPTNFVVSDTKFDNVVITAFYNGVECNELADLDNCSVGPCVNSFVFPTASHLVSMERVVSVWSLHTLVFTGISTVKIAALDIERSGEVGKWYSTNVDDFSEAAAGDAHGECGFHLIVPTGVVSDTGFSISTATGVAGVAAKNIRFYPIHASSSRGLIYNYFEPFGGLAATDPAILEINRKTATSNNTLYGVLAIGAQQSGTDHLVGIIPFVNSALVGVGERRIAQIGAATVGGTNNGQIILATAIAGTVAARVTITKDVLTSFGPFAEAEGAVLSVSGNAIAFTHSVHHVGAGLIKNITVPATFISGTIYLIPDAAFTYDATGNIIVAGGGGTATVGRVMTATFSSSTSKWYMSY